jgi:hypothetical protein
MQKIEITEQEYLRIRANKDSLPKGACLLRETAYYVTFSSLRPPKDPSKAPRRSSRTPLTLGDSLDSVLKKGRKPFSKEQVRAYDLLRTWLNGKPITSGILSRRLAKTMGCPKSTASYCIGLFIKAGILKEAFI